MPGSARKTIMPALACATTLTLVACGGGSDGKEIPADEAKVLRDTLAQVEASYNTVPPACEEAKAGAGRLQEEAKDLDEDIEAREALAEGAGNLEDLIDRDCEEEEQTTTTTTETTDTETDEEGEEKDEKDTTKETDTEPTTTDTEPTTTETETDTPTTPTAPPGGGTGGGGGSGGISP